MDKLKFEQFKSNLKEALKDLPGLEAHDRMMPSIRRNFPMDLNNIPDAKLSSVLLLLYPHKGQLVVPLTRRHDYNGTHSGQISLPGGKHEGEETRIETALREAREEVGVDQVEVLGTLTEMYIPPSNFKVLPVIGVVHERPKLVKEEFEVAEILEVGVSQFLDDANYKVMDMPVRGGKLKNTPYFDIHGHIVWGATAMIMNEMVEVIKNVK